MNLLYTNDTLFESGSGCETHDKFCVIIINSCHRGSLAVSVRILSLWLRNFIIIYLRTVLNFRELEEGQPIFFLLGGFMFSNT